MIDVRSETPEVRSAIIAVVAGTVEAGGVPYTELMGPCRSHPLVMRRTLGMRAAKALTGASYKSIGRRFGDRDPKTVQHALKRADHWLKDPAAAKLYQDILLAAKMRIDHGCACPCCGAAG